MADLKALLKEEVKERQIIRNHPLENKEDYVKELYFTILAGVVVADKEVKSEELDFFTRLIRGMGMNYEAAKFIKESEEKFNKDTIRDFLDNMQQHQLVYSFVVDALIMAKIDTVFHENESELIGLLCDTLTLKEEDLKILTNIAALILEGKGAAIQKINFHEGCDISMLDFSHYFDLLGGVEVTLSTRDFNREEIPAGIYSIQTPVELKDSSIKLHGSKFRFTDEGALTLRMMENVEIAECSFGNASIMIEHAKKLSIKKSLFKDNTRQCISIKICANGTIENTEFSNMKIKMQKKDIHGGAIYIQHSHIDMTACRFENISRDGEERTLLGGALYIEENPNYEKRPVIKECMFMNCVAYNGGAVYLMTSDKKNQYVFNKCEFVDCLATEAGSIINVGIYGSYRVTKETFTSCIFRNTSLYFQPNSNEAFFSKCQFITSRMHADNASYTNILYGANTQVNSSLKVDNGYSWIDIILK